jgi:hypothetical protein
VPPTASNASIVINTIHESTFIMRSELRDSFSNIIVSIIDGNADDAPFQRVPSVR